MDEFEEILKDLYAAKTAIEQNAKIATAQNEKLVKLESRLNLLLNSFQGTKDELQKIHSQYASLNREQLIQVKSGISDAVKEASSIYNAIPHNFKLEDKTRFLGWGIVGLIVVLVVAFKWFTFSGLKEDNRKNEQILDNQLEYIEWVEKNYPKASTEAYDKYLEKEATIKK